LPERLIASLPTPAALVDLDRMEANLRRMQEYATRHGLGLRPHTKTHKTRWIAERQMELGARGLTVATATEAAALAPATDDLLLAYPTFGARARAAAESAARRTTLVALDSIDAVHALRQAVNDAGAGEVGVLVELDVGMRRCGVSGAEQAIAVAQACGDGVPYRGLMFYPGHIRDMLSVQDDALASLARTLDAVVDALGEADLAPEIVSGGSTPTAFRSHELPHQTEIRPGTYVFNDRTSAGLDACGLDDCAYTILATVISTAVAGQAVVDAGSKALSSDPIRAPALEGFGQLLGRPEVTVDRMSEEHGVLDLSLTDWRPRLGERVRIIPNHVCVSVNLQRELHGVRGEAVERSWRLDATGWGA